MDYRTWTSKSLEPSAYSDKPKRTYWHFDRHLKAGKPYPKKLNPEAVAKHAFLPLVQFEKPKIRYKDDANGIRRIQRKTRPICFASHTDAFIFEYYAELLGEKLDQFYKDQNLSQHVAAYRSVGRKANYDFANDVFNYCRKNQNDLVVLAYDLEDFFGSLDHKILKERLKDVLSQPTLEPDWFAIWKSITRYHFVNAADLKNRPNLIAECEAFKERKFYAPFKNLKRAGLVPIPNPNSNKGIPQGTPISAVLSNLYMVEFDKAVSKAVKNLNGYYLRYSDDILIVCNLEDENQAEQAVVSAASKHKLTMHLTPPKKQRTEMLIADPNGRTAQYLGLNFNRTSMSLRPSSIARQHQRRRRSLRKGVWDAKQALKKGSRNGLFTKKLYRRFAKSGRHGFAKYGLMAARGNQSATIKHPAIKNQIKKLEKIAIREIQEAVLEVEEYARQIGVALI